MRRGVQDPFSSAATVIVSRSELSSLFCSSAFALGFLALFECARCRIGVAGGVVLRVVGIFQSGAADASARRARQSSWSPATRLMPAQYRFTVQLIVNLSNSFRNLSLNLNWYL